MSERLNRMFARPMTRRDNGKETLTVADWVPTVDIEEEEQDIRLPRSYPASKNKT
jgi:hypothetical protein